MDVGGARQGPIAATQLERVFQKAMDVRVQHVAVAGPSEAYSALRRRGDMSARHGSWGSVGQGLEAGLPDSGSAWTPGHGVGDGGPVWPIRLASNCGQGGVHEIEALGRSGHSGPRSYGIGVIAGYKGRVAVNTSRKGRFRPKKSPSMQDRSSPQGVVTLLPVSHPGCSARTVALASLGT